VKPKRRRARKSAPPRSNPVVDLLSALLVHKYKEEANKPALYKPEMKSMGTSTEKPEMKSMGTSTDIDVRDRMLSLIKSSVPDAESPMIPPSLPETTDVRDRMLSLIKSSVPVAESPMIPPSLPETTDLTTGDPANAIRQVLKWSKKGRELDAMIREDIDVGK